MTLCQPPCRAPLPHSRRLQATTESSQKFNLNQPEPLRIFAPNAILAKFCIVKWCLSVQFIRRPELDAIPTNPARARKRGIRLAFQRRTRPCAPDIPHQIAPAIASAQLAWLYRLTRLPIDSDVKLVIHFPQQPTKVVYCRQLRKC